MSAATNVRDTKQRTGDVDAALVTAVTVYKGTLVVLDTATGYCKPAVTGTGLVCLGIAVQAAPSTSTTGISSGVTKIPVRPGRWLLANSSASDEITNAWRGQPCFIVDNQTVAKTDGSATRSVAGTVEEVVTAGVWVNVGTVNGTSLAAEIAAREALDTDLKSATGTTLSGVLGAKQVAESLTSNVVGAIPVVYRVTVADAASADTDVTITYKTLITNVTVIKTAGAGGASDTIQVKNSTNAITDAMSINVADQAVVRAATINDAYSAIAAGGTLRVAMTKVAAANTACVVIVQGIRVA